MGYYRKPSEGHLLARANGGTGEPAAETMRQVHAQIKSNANRWMLRQSLNLVAACTALMAVCIGAQLLGDAIQGIGQSAPETGPSRSQ